MQGTKVVSTTRTNTHGHFTLDLLAGRYQIVAVNIAGYKSRATHTIDVRSDTIVDLTLDSGIR